MKITAVDGSGRSIEQTSEIDPPEPGRVYNVEFWHVDQSLRIFVDGDRVGEPLLYDWNPLERITHTFGLDLEGWKQAFAPVSGRPEATRPVLLWRFAGSPLTIHRLRVDRDLYYRPDRLWTGYQRNRPRISGKAAFGTHPDNLAILGPDHFFMLGDNSPASSDSRLWGRPHPLVAHQIDDSPFLVHRSLLLGKAWVVYFPAPYALSDGGRGLIPDFGRLRFIR